VTQETVLFDETIASKIAAWIGWRPAGHRAAARRARPIPSAALPLMMRRPMSAPEAVGRQRRASCVRARSKNSPILILDSDVVADEIGAAGPALQNRCKRTARHRPTVCPPSGGSMHHRPERGCVAEIGR
jgi:hypothetical protein